MHLHDGHTIIKINNQARKVIPFSMDQPENICSRIIYKPQRFPVDNCFPELIPEKIDIGFNPGKREDPYCNGSRLVMAYCKELVLVIVNFYKIAFDRCSVNFFNSSGEYPWMISPG